MNYLFFDIECIDAVHLCEFGYVLTDDRFLEIERDNLLVCPEDYSFVWEPLTYTEEEYLAAPKFPDVHEKIRSLLEREEQVAVGFSVGNDVSFLAYACRKYGLPMFLFPHIDTQVLYGVKVGKPHSMPSLESATADLNLSFSGNMHRAVDDAYMTMKVFRNIVRASKKTVATLLSECPRAEAHTKTYRFRYIGTDMNEGLRFFLKDPSCLNEKHKEKLMKRYLDVMKPAAVKGAPPLPLAGEVYLFPSEFEKKKPRETLALIDRLLALGADYAYGPKPKFTVFVCDRTDPVNENDPRDRYSQYAKAKWLVESGKDVRIIPFSELLATVSLTAEELPTASVRPMPDVAEELRAFGNDKTDVKPTAGSILLKNINYDDLPDE